MMEEKTQQCLDVSPGNVPASALQPRCLPAGGERCLGIRPAWPGPAWQHRRLWGGLGLALRLGVDPPLASSRGVPHHSPPCIFPPSGSHPGRSLLFGSQMLFWSCSWGWGF